MTCGEMRMRFVDIFGRRGALYMILSCLGMQPERDNIVPVSGASRGRLMNDLTTTYPAAGFALRRSVRSGDNTTISPQ